VKTQLPTSTNSNLIHSIPTSTTPIAPFLSTTQQQPVVSSTVAPQITTSANSSTNTQIPTQSNPNNIQIPQQDISRSEIFCEIMKFIFLNCFILMALVYGAKIPLVIAIIIIFSFYAFLWTHT
jgi:hypothetical protein